MPFQSDIDDVVLVGGSSRIPRVQVLIQKLFANKTLKFDIPPDHAVAHGAAILVSNLSKIKTKFESQAESLSKSTNLPVKSSVGAVKLVDVTPYSLGIGMVNDRMGFIMKKNTRYPAVAHDVRVNAFDNQTSLNFPVRQIY